MSALAQFQVLRGGTASGSDRAFDRGERAEARARLERLGIVVTAQDGAWAKDPFAASPHYELVETKNGEWRIYRRKPPRS